MNSKIVNIDGHEIALSNLDKVFFPESVITKGDVISFYEDISPLMLPFCKNRFLTMWRCPDGIQAQQFVQKNASPYFPKWIKRRALKQEGIKYVLLNDTAALIYLANQACVSFHITLSKVEKSHYPTYLIFDLDPSGADLMVLKKVVKMVKALLDELGLPSFIQTTGSHGFHIYVPLKQDTTFKKAHDFVKACAQYLINKHPEFITIEQRKNKRGNRVLIDYARNSFGLSSVSPYSLRVIENAPIATPIHWGEFDDKHLTSQTYNLKNIFKRLSHVEDPWKDMENHRVSLKTIQIPGI